MEMQLPSSFLLETANSAGIRKGSKKALMKKVKCCPGKDNLFVFWTWMATKSEIVSSFFNISTQWDKLCKKKEIN